MYIYIYIYIYNMVEALPGSAAGSLLGDRPPPKHMYVGVCIYIYTYTDMHTYFVIDS